MQKEEPNTWKKKKEELSSFSFYSAMTFQMLVIIAAGVFGGLGLDRLLKLSFPVFTLVLSFLAVLLAMYYFIRDLMHFRK